MGKSQGPRAFGGPADFSGLTVVCGAMFFGTAPHGFGRTYYICIGALGPDVLLGRFRFQYAYEFKYEFRAVDWAQLELVPIR